MKQKQLLVLLMFLCLLLLRFAPVFWAYTDKSFIYSGGADPLFYLGGARSMLSQGFNPFNFFSPLYFFFVAILLVIGNGHVITPVVATALTGWLTVIGCYQLAKILFDKKTAVISAILIGCYPNFIYFGGSLFPETLAVFWIVFSFLMAVKYLQLSKHYYLILSAALWGLASQTRGGLHYFSVFIALIILIIGYKEKKTISWKPFILYLITTYGTIVSIGVLVYPLQGDFGLNSKSGLGSFIHGVNRITTSCADYGDIKGNIFYDINDCAFEIKDCGEKWPDDSQIYSKDILKLGTGEIVIKAASFIWQSPAVYIKNSFGKLSCFWSPNQLIIHYLKTRFYNNHRIMVEGMCAGISLYYVFMICGGLWGITVSRDDPFRSIFISFIIFYCVLIFLTVGNSKLRFPLMPFLIMYAAYFISQSYMQGRGWIKAFSNKWIIILILVFLCNSIYKYKEIALSPAEINVKKIELCNDLGFHRTAIYLYNKYNNNKIYTAAQVNRMNAAHENATNKIQKITDK